MYVWFYPGYLIVCGNWFGNGCKMAVCTQNKKAVINTITAFFVPILMVEMWGLEPQTLTLPGSVRASAEASIYVHIF